MHIKLPLAVAQRSALPTASHYTNKYEKFPKRFCRTRKILCHNEILCAIKEHSLSLLKCAPSLMRAVHVLISFRRFFVSLRRYSPASFQAGQKH